MERRIDTENDARSILSALEEKLSMINDGRLSVDKAIENDIRTLAVALRTNLEGLAEARKEMLLYPINSRLKSEVQDYLKGLGNAIHGGKGLLAQIPDSPCHELESVQAQTIANILRRLVTLAYSLAGRATGHFVFVPDQSSLGLGEGYYAVAYHPGKPQKPRIGHGHTGCLTPSQAIVVHQKPAKQ